MTIGKQLLGVALCGFISFCAMAQTRPVKSTQQSPQQKESRMQTQMQSESPFACNMNALNAAQRKRQTALIIKLGQLRQEVRELPDGYGFRFPAEVAVFQELAEFVVNERLCCPFFDFELKLAREGGPLWLNLTGRTGVKAFIRAEFGLK